MILVEQIVYWKRFSNMGKKLSIYWFEYHADK